MYIIYIYIYIHTHTHEGLAGAFPGAALEVGGDNLDLH